MKNILSSSGCAITTPTGPRNTYDGDAVILRCAGRSGVGFSRLTSPVALFPFNGGAAQSRSAAVCRSAESQREKSQILSLEKYFLRQPTRSNFSSTQFTVAFTRLVVAGRTVGSAVAVKMTQRKGKTRGEYSSVQERVKRQNLKKFKIQSWGLDRMLHTPSPPYIMRNATTRNLQHSRRRPS